MNYLPYIAGGVALGYLSRHSRGRRGVYDPGILKAVFLAGGPGSGKSYVAKQVFGLTSSSFAPSGLKLVNSDPAFEMLLDRDGYSPADLADLAATDPETYRYLTEDSRGPRQRGKRLTDARTEKWLDARLGVIVDGTGKQYQKIAKAREGLQNLGYDTAMIFVNTTLPVAMYRNQQRARKLPDAQVKKHWTQVQSNLGAFQTLFGRQLFYLVDNSRPVPVAPAVIKDVQRFVQKPVRNPVGQNWIANELEKKKR
jgi:predicted kinase|tara:strand:+ start:541 stop:1302 length:762 start_codon:yes stop_codon:yes gene_type:complete